MLFRSHQLKTTLKNNNNIIIITERSIHTDREVFAKMLYDQKNMSKIEYEIYNKWFEQFLEECKIDGIIYVNTSPIKCLERINKRNRKGEDNMSIDYLKDCNTYHNDWIDTSDIDNIILDGNEEIPLKGDSRIFYAHKSQSQFKLIHPKEHDFFEACREKLGWSLDISKK